MEAWKKKLIEETFHTKRIDINAADVINLLSEIESTQLTMSRLWTKQCTIEARHIEEIKAVKREIREAQEKCKHPSWEYHGDPAGGSDSHSTCNVCDMQKDGMH